MVQKILCLACGDETNATHKADNPEQYGEHVKFVKGESKNHFVCDHCGKPLAPEEVVYAYSIWSSHGGIPYYAWEKGYIKEIVSE